MHRLPVGKRTRLAELESKMELAERHVTCWLESIQAIRDEQLYLDQYETFEDYCQKRWGKTRRRMDQLIVHQEIVAQIEDQSGANLRTTVLRNGQAGEEMPLPTNERQTRPLADLPEAERGDAWEEAVASANGQAPTSKQVAAVVKTTRPPPYSKAKAAKKSKSGSETFNFHEYEKSLGIVARGPDDLGRAYKGEKDSPEYEKCIGYLESFTAVWKSWHKRLTK